MRRLFGPALVALVVAGGAAAQIAAERAPPPPPRPERSPAQAGGSEGASAGAAVAEPAPVEIPDRPGAMLRGLDKFTGVAEDFFAPLDETTAFGRLEITLRACRLDDEGEAAAWLYIADPKQGPAPSFAGWMFAESPALSALDHPRYDVWVAACSTSSADAE